LEVSEGAGSPNLLKVDSFLLFPTFTCNLHLSTVMKKVLTRRRAYIEKNIFFGYNHPMNSNAQKKSPYKGKKQKRENIPVPPVIALSSWDSRSIDRLTCAKERPEINGRLWPPGRLGPALTGFLKGRKVSRIHFGNEFCENLIPTPASLEKILAQAAAAGMSFTLVTPLLTDSSKERLVRLLDMLPRGTEVVVNDWGLLRLLYRDFPALEAVAGRQLCKTIKDPRVPSPQWARVNPPVPALELLEFLEEFAVQRMEVDVPPFAETNDFKPRGMKMSVHGLLGYCLKGRICKIGSMKLEREKKFSPAIACGKECLRYIAKAVRQNVSVNTRELQTFQRGNTMFYRHSPDQCETLLSAVERGWIDRFILPGDWNENSSSD
jgi:hypothetical protein